MKACSTVVATVCLLSLIFSRYELRAQALEATSGAGALARKLELEAAETLLSRKLSAFSFDADQARLDPAVARKRLAQDLRLAQSDKLRAEAKAMLSPDSLRLGIFGSKEFLWKPASVRAAKTSPRSTPAPFGSYTGPKWSLLRSFTQLYWKRTESGESATFAVFQGDSPESGKQLSSMELAMKVRAPGALLINEGDVPVQDIRWRELMAGFPTIVHEPGSANDSWESTLKATELGDRFLSPAAKIYNALPHQSSVDLGVKELERMGLDGQPEDWAYISRRIREEAEGIHTVVATKSALLEELRSGTSDMVVVYAHFDGSRLFLPGADLSLDEGSISVTELAELERSGPAGDRVVVLVACRGAARIQGKSLAGILLANGLASTVFATQDYYDARDIPMLIKRLGQKASLRTADPRLLQLVELQGPESEEYGHLGERRTIYEGF